MRRSNFALLIAGMFIVAGAPDLRAQDAETEAAGDAAADAVAETRSDVRVVDATFLNGDGREPMALNAEFSGSGDDLTAALTVPGTDLRVELNELFFTDDAFNFSFIAPGEDLLIECSLFKLHDESFRGECFAGDDGTSGEMTIGAFEN